jgi:flagellum-specific peptidoglycan hydrolase FlgJ
MATACMNEAVRIRRTQTDVLVAGGFRSEPDPDELRKADVFEAAARFLDEIAPKAQQVLSVIRRR